MNDEFEDVRQEQLAWNLKAKKALREAKREDFQIIRIEDSSYPYAVSLWGCHDLAKFQRKADAEKFIGTFAV